MRPQFDDRDIAELGIEKAMVAIDNSGKAYGQIAQTGVEPMISECLRLPTNLFLKPRFVIEVTEEVDRRLLRVRGLSGGPSCDLEPAATAIGVSLCQPGLQVAPLLFFERFGNVTLPLGRQ